MAGTKNAGNKLSEERKKEYLDGKAAVNAGVVKLNEAIKKRNEQERKKTAADRMWDRGSQTSASEKTFAKRDLEASKQNVAQKEKELSDYQENTNLDWTKAAARELYEKGEKQKKQEIAQAQAEQNAAVARLDSLQMGSLSEEDRGLIDEYIRREDTASDPIDTGTAAITEHFANNLGIDEKRLKELVETRRRELNAQRMQETREKAQAEVNDGVGSAVLANALTIPANLMSGAMSTMGYIHELANRDERYIGLDPNNMGNELNVYSGAVRGQTQQNIVGDGSSLVRRGLGTLYQAGMSAADTGVRAAVGGGLGLGAGFGATVAGLNTFGQTMSDASARGATPEQALLLAVTTAGIEAATEKVPLDNLILVSKGGGAKSLIKNILRQAGIEATEEELSLIGTTLADAAIMQEKSEYSQTVLEYMAQGMTMEQAREQANWGLIREAGETAVVSGIAGGIGGFGAAKAAAFNGDNLDAAPQQTAQQPQTEQNQQVEQSPVIQEAAVQAAQEAQKPMTETDPAKPVMNQRSAPQADTHNASAQEGQEIPDGMKGIGAAEQNFSGKPAYNAVLSADNAQADRADDVRPMELPKQDAEGGAVSAVTGNVYASKITPEEFASLMEEPTAKGDFSYVQISNDKATELAKQSIERSGDWQTAYVDWAKAVERGQAGAEMSARGAMLLNKAAQDGDKAQWLRVLSDMQSLGTNTAQGLQAFRLIRTLSPPDKLEFAKASVKKLAESMNLKNDIVIDESLLNAYQNAQTDEQRNDIMGKIQQNVAGQIPSTALDKINALRYLNMLGNLKTNVRNVTGNIGAGAAYRAKDTIAAGLERAVYTLSGGKTELTKSMFVNPDLKKAAVADFDQFAGIIADGGKYSVTGSGDGDFAQGVMDKRTIFKFKPLEAARKASNWALNNKYFGDEAFGRAAYSRALAGYLQANGVKDADLSKVDSGLMDKARTYAVKQAQEATFHDNNVVSRTLVKLQRDTGIVGQGIMPFAKTPANVLVRAEEFSPLGFINSTLKTIQAAAGNTKAADSDGIVGKWARNGQEITGADLIDSWAKSFTGAGLFVLGAWLKDTGWITGGPDEDEDKAAFDQLNGIQPYALMLPDGTNVTIDFLSPVAMPLFMGAQAYKLMSEGGDFSYEKLEKIATSLADPMIQMSMLQGVDSTLNDIKYADNNLGQFLINACVSYLTQGLKSTLGGQIERSFEKERMTTYVDKDSGVPSWMQKQLGRASQKIPGWDYQQTPYINSRGETEKNMEGAAGLLYNFASPGYIDKKEIDAVSQELYRLNDSATFEGSIFPDVPAATFDYTGKDGTQHKGFNLSTQQADTLKRVTGQTGTKILSGMIQSKDYAAMTDKQKAEAVKLAYQYAQEKGRLAALEDYPELSGWQAGIDGKEAEAIIRKVNADTLDNAISALTTAWANGWDDSEKTKALETAYSTLGEMSRQTRKDVLAESSQKIRDYADARDAGISNQKYVNILKSKAAAAKRYGVDKLNQGQSIELISKVSGVTDAQKEVLLKADVSDVQDKAIDDLEAFVKENNLPQNYLKLYASAYDIVINYTHDYGKKDRTAEYLKKLYGLTTKQAYELYEMIPQ